MASARTRQLVGTLAATKRHHPETDVTPLLGDLAAQRLEDYITKVVAAAPPLTPEQRDRLALLLRPVGGDGA